MLNIDKVTTHIKFMLSVQVV